jgi:hypothetical protein
MFFDAVRNDSGDVLFNGTTDETVQWLKSAIIKQDVSEWNVVRGRDLRIMTVQEFLS